jgi:hypothetical protein
MTALIISHYNENLDWINEINNNIHIFIYNKGEKIININKKNTQVINLKNVGREAHTYIYHIVNNYYNLEDLIFFSKGNSLEHYKNFVKDVNNHSYGWLTDKHIYVSDLYGNPQHPNLPIKEFSDLINLKLKNDFFVLWKPHSLFSVKKTNILKRDINFYINILNIIEKYHDDNSNIPQYEYNKYNTGLIATPWILERLWGEIFDIR